jgi:hypothetical protein
LSPKRLALEDGVSRARGKLRKPALVEALGGGEWHHRGEDDGHPRRVQGSGDLLWRPAVGTFNLLREVFRQTEI